MSEEDSYTGYLYWREDDLVARFVALESDVVDMIDCKIRLAAGDVRLGSESEDYVRGYLDALEEYTEDIEFIINSRFKEIMSKVKVEKESDGKIDLGELGK